MKILLLDSYDSFTYNLSHIVEAAGYEIDVIRNDKIPLEDVAQYDKIMLSPGPGLPRESGILCALVERYAPTKSILGVCLGNQAIGEVFGAELIHLQDVFHGVQTPVRITKDDYLFAGLPDKIEVGRYHSWVVNPASVSGDLEIIAEDDSAQIMALRHKKYDVRGVQFHPESVLTPQGKIIIENFLRH